MAGSNTSPNERIREAIAALPEPTRSAYLMHLLDGLSYDAIAMILRIGIPDVEAHIARAIVSIDCRLRGAGSPGSG